MNNNMTTRDKITNSWYRTRARIRKIMELEYDFNKAPFVRCEGCGERIPSWTKEYHKPVKLCTGCRLGINRHMMRRIGYNKSYSWRLARIFVRSPIQTPGDIQLEIKRETQTNSFAAYTSLGCKELELPKNLAKCIIDYAFRKEARK